MIKTVVFDPEVLKVAPYVTEFLESVERKKICAASIDYPGLPHKDLLQIILPPEGKTHDQLYQLVQITPESHLVVCSAFLDCNTLREKNVDAYFLDLEKENRKSKIRYKIHNILELTYHF
jgi:hypothetical protein